MRRLATAASSRSRDEMAAYKNFVTVMSFYSRYLVTAVSFSAKNLVTVTSRNFVTVMSFVSRKRVEAVPRYLATAASLCKNFVTEMSLSSKTFSLVACLVVGLLGHGEGAVVASEDVR